MANWTRLPSGWALNLDQVVIAEALRWTTRATGEIIPSLTLIVPGGGLQSEYSDSVIPATYTLVGDDALAAWWWSRTLPPLTVPEEARAVADTLRPLHLRGAAPSSGWPD
jgi:hypothetical protein